MGTRNARLDAKSNLYGCKWLQTGQTIANGATVNIQRGSLLYDNGGYCAGALDLMSIVTDGVYTSSSAACRSIADPGYRDVAAAQHPAASRSSPPSTSHPANNRSYVSATAHSRFGAGDTLAVSMTNEHTGPAIFTANVTLTLVAP